MPWSDPQSMISTLLGPSPLAIIITLVLALSIPLLLHLLFYRSTSTTSLPSFLLVGPSGSGKTALLTLLERGYSATTHTSQSPLAVEVSLPVSTNTASSRYRSINDPSLHVHRRFLLIDTPGHGKLRYHAFGNMTRPQNMKGIIFMVDAANISTGSDGDEGQGLREAAQYLHDTLLQLQKRSTISKTSKYLQPVPVLIAVNKLDLFTALPATIVKTALESEITKIRRSRLKGLLDSGIGTNDPEADEEREWLGDGGDGPFKFSQLEEADVTIAVVGGNVQGADIADVAGWWEWIGSNL